MRTWINQRPEIRQKITDLKRQNPHQGLRCSLLTADGACSVYEGRPIVCRSHGAPLKLKDKGVDRRDVCPLNFSGDISSLSGEDLLNLDLLNTLLSLITQQFGASEERIPLADL
jgi:Fe-S-cluster containining protein